MIVRNTSNKDEDRMEIEEGLTEEERKHITEFIELSIEHLLDFSTDSTELIQQIKMFNEACNQEVSDTHDFYQLRKVLLTPTTMLTGLDRINNHVSVNQVSDLILNIIENRLTAAAKKADINLLQHCNFQSLRTRFSNAQNGNEEFKSVPVQPPAHVGPIYMPWQIIEESYDRYEAYLDFNDAKTHAMLCVRIPLLGNRTHPVDIYFKVKPNFNGTASQQGQQEDAFLRGLIPEAKEYAREKATKVTLDNLWKNKIISDTDYAVASENWQGLSHIVNHRFYYPLIVNKTKKIRSFILPPKTIETLIDPTTIKLLTDKLCTYKQAMNLQNSHLQFCNLYYSSIEDGTILIEKILLMPAELAQILVKPNIFNFLKKHPEEIKTALLLPLCLGDFLTSPFHSDYLTRIAEKNPQLLQTLVKLKPFHSEFILSKDGIKLLSENVIALEDIVQFSEESIKILTSKKIQYLLIKKVITIDELKNSFLETINKIDRNPCYFDWLCAKIINLKDLDGENTFNSIAIIVFARRLFAVYQQQPYRIDDKLDTARSIKLSLLEFSDQHKLTWEVLASNILNKLFLIIHDQLKNETEADEAEAFEYIFKNYIPHTKNISWEQAYNNLLTLTDAQIKMLVEKSRIDIYKKSNIDSHSWMLLYNHITKKNANALQTFFDNVLVLNDFISDQPNCNRNNLRRN